MRKKIIQKMQQLIDSLPKGERRKQLLKELLDLELITKEEFDKKSKELKKIILGN